MSLDIVETKFRFLHEESSKYWPEDLQGILTAVGDFLDDASEVEKQAFEDNVRLMQRDCYLTRLEMLMELGFSVELHKMQTALDNRDRLSKEVEARMKTENYKAAFQRPDTYRKDIMSICQIRPNLVWNPEDMANCRLEGFLLKECEL